MQSFKLQCKNAANYENMKRGESIMLFYFGESKFFAYKGNEEIDIASVKSYVKLTKNYSTPHFALVANLIKIHTNLSVSSKSVDFIILIQKQKQN